MFCCSPRNAEFVGSVVHKASVTDDTNFTATLCFFSVSHTRPRSIHSLLSCLGPHVMFSCISISASTVISVAKLSGLESCSATFYVFDLKEVTDSVLQFPYL